MRITNLNPDSDIGASSWLVETELGNLLMDAGMHPKREGREALPLYKLLDRKELDTIAISHCHHDHVGSLPVAARYSRKAHIIMTEQSYCLAGRVLHNSVNVMVRQKEERGVREYPLFSHDEVEELEEIFQGFKYNREIEWAGFHRSRSGPGSPTLEFFDAGHTLGSAGILVRSGSETMFFTGDVCFHDQTILQAARFDNIHADVLIMETTRGNTAHGPDFSRKSEVERLEAEIQNVLARRGSVLIPAFALGRSQEILADLALMMRAKKIPRQPIYIGGLGRVFTEIYDNKSYLSQRQLPNMQLMEELQLVVLERDQMASMKLGGGKLFVLTAGMLTEGTPAHEVARRMIEDERHSIFFVGYADPDTPGGRLKCSKLGEEFLFSADAGKLTRKCDMQQFDLTAHASREALVDFAGRVNPKTILLGHGDFVARQWFEQQLRAKYPHIRIVQPEPGLVVET